MTICDTISHQDHPLHTQENRIYNLKSFWDEGMGQEGSPINLHSKKYIRILQMLETQLKKIEKEILYSTTLSHIFPLWHPYVAIIAITFLSSIPSGHDHVTLLYLHTSLLPIIPWTPNQLPSTPNMV